MEHTRSCPMLQIGVKGENGEGIARVVKREERGANSYL